ncbi:MAG: T9SS type A sorting domain-containing protein [Bacteroidales bacterium]|nr:T9SS type A sorting domain-containing protein [Bacteroidales bacterium]
MKSKLLPLSLFTLILGITSIILATGLSSGSDQKNQEDDSAIKVAAEYLNKIRRNQVTLRVDPADEINARQTAEASALKSGNSLNLSWESMGPDNAPGVVRSMVYDNQASTESLILAGATGGIWRTNNLGATWTKLNQAGQNLKVSCMVQDADGNIYAGTGDGFCTNDIQYTQNNIYYSGIVGEGIFKSSDQNNFVQLPATAPNITQENDTVDFAYVYDLAMDNTNNRLYSATNTGLWYSDDKGDSWSKVLRYESDSITYGVTLHIDSTLYVDSLYFDETTQQWEYNQVLEKVIDTSMFETVEESRINDEKEFGIVECSAVEVGTSGVVMATFNNKVYVSSGGNNPVFKNVSSNPSNDDFFNRDIKYYTTNLTLIDTNNQVFNRGQIQFNDTLDYSKVAEPNSPYSIATQGRTQIAIAPSDDNVYYAVCSGALGYMDNMYLSTDRGETWEIIFPGGSNSSLLPFNGSSCFNMTLTVFPDNPYKVLLGGDDLWLGEQLGAGEFYNWGAGPISSSAFPGFFNYLPRGHHSYVFSPNSNSKFAVATSQGIAFGTFTSQGVSFQQIVRGLSNTQVYTLGISGDRKAFLAGVQSSGVQYISGLGNTPQTGENVYGVSGGSCQMSIINPSAFMLSDLDGSMNRTGDKGISFSLNFTPPTTNLVITPFAKWESFNDDKSKMLVKFIADKNYYQGDVLLCHSANKGIEGGKGYPFTSILEQDSIVAGDSIYVKDIVQSKFFIATHNAVYMTRDIVKFDSTVTYAPTYDGRKNIFKVLQTVGNFSKPSCLGLSSCGNYLFVGTENGRIYRIANIQDSFDKESTDVDSPFCVLSVNEIIPAEMSNRYLTSISVDPQNPEHILVTLGNYGNESYVFQSMNALDAVDAITFTDLTGSLPKMPVYSSIIEMNNSEIGLIGTELGIYSTQGLLSGTPEWTIDASGIGKAMVVRMQQQTVYKAGFVLEAPDPTSPAIVYPAVNNYGDIYCATFGRGVFRDATYHLPVGIPETYSPGSPDNLIAVDVYPNPVVNTANISYTLATNESVTINVNDISGKLVKQFDLNMQSEGKHDFSFDCNELISGVYIISVRAGSSYQNAKFVVK